MSKTRMMRCKGKGLKLCRTGCRHSVEHEHDKYCDIKQLDTCQGTCIPVKKERKQ